MNISREVLEMLAMMNEPGKAWLEQQGYIIRAIVDDEYQVEVTDSGWEYFRKMIASYHRGGP